MVKRALGISRRRHQVEIIGWRQIFFLKTTENLTRICLNKNIKFIYITECLGEGYLQSQLDPAFNDTLRFISRSRFPSDGSILKVILLVAANMALAASNTKAP